MFARIARALFGTTNDRALKRLQARVPDVNALEPGFVGTNLFDNMGGLVKWAVNAFSKTAAQGAETSIYLASWWPRW